MKHQKLQRRIAAKGGSYALAVTAVVLAILIAVNILASVLPTTLTKLDISSTKLYSITSSTKVVVNNLEKDVTIYWVVQSDKEDAVIENLLGKYESLSSHITVTKKNPDVYPTFTAQYTDEDVPNNSLIVECGEKSRYIDLLFCFLAISLHGWKRRILLIGAAAHILCSALRCFTSVTLFYGRLMDWLGFGLFLLAVLLMLLSHERMLRRTSLCLSCAAGVLVAAWCVSRFVGVEYLYPLSNPITSLLYGNPKALYTLLCAVTGLLCAVQVVAEFIRTAFSRQRQMIALQSRSQQAQEQYKQAQESLRNVSAFRHEWKNHISVLSLLQRKGDTEGLTEYLAQLDDQLEQLSPLHYTANFIVNTVLQRYVAKAKEIGAAFHATAPLPAELSIDEDDLCSFLFNLLDNAAEGAAGTPSGKPREIRCSLQIRQGYLAIRCENTFSGVVALDEENNLLTTKTASADHGYGLIQMRRIAAKYGSTLSVSYNAERFTVMTALKLP